MKTKFFCSLPILGLILIYFLFEPVIQYNFGWRKLPHNPGVDAVSAGMSTGNYQSAVKNAEHILREARETLNAPAMSFAVGIDGKLVWASAVGFMDIEGREKADTTTQFRIGSTSKAMTSVGLGLLLENKTIVLDSSVQYYVPYAKSMRERVTVRQLASHTSGVRNYEACWCFPVFEYYNNDYHASLKESSRYFINDPLLFKPGTAYAYSSYNFTLLSAAMEEASHVPFLEYMQQNVFTPMHMTHTSGDFADRKIPSRAKFYEIRGREYKEVYDVDNSSKWAGGGFISTPADLVKLGNELLTNQFLPEEILDTLWSVQRLADGTLNEEGYALGWRVNPEGKIGEHTTLVAHHGGTALGATSFLILIPEYKMTISIMMNRNSPETFSEFSAYAYRLAKTFVEPEQ